MKRFLLTTLTAISLTFAGTLVPATVNAAPVDSAKNEVCKSIRVADATCGAGGGTLKAIVEGVLNILSVIAGVAAVIMIIIAGIKYVTSNGDSNSISGAKRTLVYALVGLLIAASAQLIVRFVIQSVNT